MHPLILYMFLNLDDGGAPPVVVTPPGGAVAKGKRFGFGILHRRVNSRV